MWSYIYRRRVLFNLQQAQSSQMLKTITVMYLKKIVQVEFHL